MAKTCSEDRGSRSVEQMDPRYQENLMELCRYACSWGTYEYGL